jgi:hypothetical protein
MRRVGALDVRLASVGYMAGWKKKDMGDDYAESSHPQTSNVKCHFTRFAAAQDTAELYS